jgi:hypothetical protein
MIILLRMKKHRLSIKVNLPKINALVTFIN